MGIKSALINNMYSLKHRINHLTRLTPYIVCPCAESMIRRVLWYSSHRQSVSPAEQTVTSPPVSCYMMYKCTSHLFYNFNKKNNSVCQVCRFDFHQCTTAAVTKQRHETIGAESWEVAMVEHERWMDDILYSALLKARHQRQGKGLHCETDKQKEKTVNALIRKSHPMLTIKRGPWLQRQISVVLTVGKRATAYSLVQYGHQEHVTVFEIRFHLINGFNPGIEKEIP